MSVQAVYEAELEARGYQSDPAQLRAVEALDRCAHEWAEYEEQRSNVRKTRLHFHEFMREVHRELADLQGTVNPLDELGERMARRFQLVCFDEFHVADITDAMILHRLLDALFDNGVGFVTTSNFKPD